MDKGKTLLEIGARFGDYMVVELLGRGAMGEVYRVVSGGTSYAVKIMAANAGDDDKARHEWRRRFAREAEAAMKIRHRNLIEVYDVGEDPQTHLCYILMEYVGGGSLADLLRRRGRLDIREAVAITMHIAGALGVAHSHGVVHRDIKPDNIMFASDGTPKLADLGIARVKDDGHDTTITNTAMMVGTPAYMAPEQMMDSHNVDARADIYSLGVVLYEMLTGERPNRGSTIVELLSKSIKGEELPDVREMRPEVSASLACALSRMVANNAGARPASAEEAARLVYDASSGSLPVKAPKAVSGGRRTWSAGRKCAVGGILAAAVAAVLAAVCAFPSRREAGGVGQEEKKGLSSQDYVQDGLLAMWDGIENAGRGLHDTNSPVWKCVVGGVDAMPINGTPRWSDNSAVLDGLLYYMVPSLFGRPQTATIEVCHRANSTAISRGGALFSSCENGGFGIQKDKKNTWHVAVARPGGWYYEEIGIGLTGEAETLAFTVSSEITSYRNAVEVGKVRGVNGIRYNDRYNYFQIARDPGQDDSLKGDIYSIRLYLRALTPEEIARNHEIDSLRFNLPKPGAGAPAAGRSREVPISEVPAALQEDIEKLRKRYNKNSKQGRLVFGRLEVEGGSTEDVATWAWLNKDGTFTAAAIKAARDGLVFAKNGYEPLVIALDDAKKPWNGDVALDLGTVRLKKLPVEKTATYSLTVRLPKGVEEGVLTLWLVNNFPCGADWGYQGRERPSPIVKKVSFRDGEKVTITGCAPFFYSCALEARGCPTCNPPYKELSSGENYLGEFSLMRTKTASFAVRPYGERGGGWKRHEVDVDGNTQLLLTDRKDGSGNRCRLFLGAYGDSGNSVFSRFGWGPTVCEDLGKMTVDELERREKANGPLPTDDKKRDFKLVPGHIYRIKNDSHWHIEVLVAFESYAEKPRADGRGQDKIHTARIGKFNWSYRLDADGNAILTSGGAKACISPRPVGKVVVPSNIDGHKVVAIGDRAFIDCDSMTEIVLAEGIKAIDGWYSFTRCRGLKEIRLPESLEQMGRWSFEACTGMKAFDFVNCRFRQDIGSTFTHNRSMSKFMVAPGNPELASIGGVLYSKDRKKLLAYPKNRETLDIVPGVRKIDGCALSSCSIRHLKIPDGVEEIADCAFEFNDGYLETVEFPKSLKKIGYVIFKGTHSIKKIVFHGDAPKCVKGSLGWNRADFVVEVERGSRGWKGPGETGLPDRWPVGAGGDSRRIRYIGDN